MFGRLDVVQEKTTDTDTMVVNRDPVKLGFGEKSTIMIVTHHRRARLVWNERV